MLTLTFIPKGLLLAREIFKRDPKFFEKSFHANF